MVARGWLALLKKRKKKPRILVLVDDDNIRSNVLKSPDFNLIRAFEELMRWLRKIGEVVGVFIFTPFLPVSETAEFFRKHSFTIIHCPKILTDEREEDTTDETLKRVGQLLLDEMPNCTHLCLCSGDADFLELLESAKDKGLKILLGVGDVSSLSSKIIRETERDPSDSTGKRRLIFNFSAAGLKAK